MVFTKYGLGDTPIRNYSENGQIAGFCFTMHQPDYKSMFLSCLVDLIVEVDGERYPREAISFELQSGRYTLDNLETEVYNRWNYIELGTVYVKKPGGLSVGQHHLEAGIVKRNSQDNTIGLWGNPAPVGGRRDFVIEEGDVVSC